MRVLHLTIAVAVAFLASAAAYPVYDTETNRGADWVTEEGDETPQTFDYTKAAPWLRPRTSYGYSWHKEEEEGRPEHHHSTTSKETEESDPVKTHKRKHEEEEVAVKEPVQKQESGSTTDDIGGLVGMMYDAVPEPEPSVWDITHEFFEELFGLEEITSAPGEAPSSMAEEPYPFDWYWYYYWPYTMPAAEPMEEIEPYYYPPTYPPMWPPVPAPEPEVEYEAVVVQPPPAKEKKHKKEPEKHKKKRGKEEEPCEAVKPCCCECPEEQPPSCHCYPTLPKRHYPSYTVPRYSPHMHYGRMFETPPYYEKPEPVSKPKKPKKHKATAVEVEPVEEVPLPCEYPLEKPEESPHPVHMKHHKTPKKSPKPSPTPSPKTYIPSHEAPHTRYSKPYPRPYYAPETEVTMHCEPPKPCETKKHHHAKEEETYPGHQYVKERSPPPHAGSGEMEHGGKGCRKCPTCEGCGPCVEDEHGCAQETPPKM